MGERSEPHRAKNNTVTRTHAPLITPLLKDNTQRLAYNTTPKRQHTKARL